MRKGKRANDPNRTVKVGDRVKYADDPEDPKNTGTIINILLKNFPFVVKWDGGTEKDLIDHFKGSQLIFAEEEE